MKNNMNKKITILTFALCAFTAQATINVSEYMMPPVSSWVSPPAQPSATNAFNLIRLRASTKATKQAAVDLAATGLVQSGDILLSFRPEWDGTLAYAHMQLGISHAALAFVVTDSNGGRFVHTLETPINYSSPMNSSHHYTDLNAIHIIRPNLSEAQRANLSGWAKKILANPSRYGFFSDYGKPWYKRAANRTPVDQIKELAKVTTSGGTFASYCSEFVWTLLGLRDCPSANYRAGSGCEKPIFSSSPNTAVAGAMTGIVPGLSGDAGLVQGPEAALVTKSAAERTRVLTQDVFEDVLRSPDQLAGRMSSGHRAVAEANSATMTAINRQYYGSGQPSQVAQGINAQVVDNFSPTSFMVRSNAGLDGFKYVGTVVFDR